ncbi:unnamed protein product [Parnassius apollo]|uniref:(apollo) hypothetical protein n=1 Tax=Parnassius apollo TaxID=110799 RepID=A0A8S3YA92_PARAO|nr:unnamed protein product [Parnassius apollo]
MCISTRPQYCPYGINDLTEGKEYRRHRTSQEKNRNEHIINHPPHSENARDITPRLNHPQATSSPNVPYSAAPGFPHTAAYPPVPGVSSIHSRTPSSLQIQIPAPNQNLPQNTNVLPKSKIVVIHTPGRSSIQEQGAAITEQRMFAPSTHLQVPESAIGRQRLNPPSHQHYSFYSPLQMQQDTAPTLGYENRRRNLPPSFQETQHRSMQYMNRSAGHSGGTRGTGLPVYHTIPDTSNESNDHGSELISVPVPCDRMIGVTKSKAPEISKVFRDPSPMESPQTRDMKYSTPVASKISHARDRVNTFLSTNENESRNVSKCSCRFPPAFKNFSCTGNINGACDCADDNAG